MLTTLNEHMQEGDDDPLPLFDSLESCRVESPDWRTYEIEADIPPGASRLAFGLYLDGSGAAWLDDVRLELVED